MPRWIRMRWLASWLFGALVFVGCAADTTTGASGVNVEIEFADGTQIDEVSYVVSLRGDELHSGTINTGSPGSTASIEIYGLAEDSGYVISMTATSTDAETTCSGSAIFNVFVGQVTGVAVMLSCKSPQELGGVRVNGTINFCSDIRWAEASPLQTSIGNQIDVYAIGRDIEGDAIEYRWTATSGSFADPSAPRTTYTCEEVGDHRITITVSDDGFEYCDCFWDVDVTCVDGDGGTGGTGGMAGTGGTGGMAGTGGTGGMAGTGGTGGMAGTGGTGGMAGTGGTGGTAGVGGTGGTAGAGGTGGSGGHGGIGGEGGSGGGGVCIPDGGAPSAGAATNRPCGGSSCDEMEVCVGGVCEPSALVFVSSTTSDAALGGPRGADETCADLAEAAGLGGYWFSWTSDPCTSPIQRFEKSTLPYRMVDGSEISPSWDRMTMNPPPTGVGYIGTPIDMDEYGDIPATSQQCASSSNPPQGCFVWTNTNVEGRVAALANNNGCLGLTTDNSAFAPSTAGKITSVSRGWTDGAFWNCGIDNLRLYCFEQSAANPIP